MAYEQNTPGDDIIDLRDVVTKRDELIERRDDKDQEDPLDEDEVTYLESVKALEDEIGEDLDSAADNEPVMISDDYFTAYAEQLADDIGAIDSNAEWPLNHIDWEAAADELKADYTEVAFGGTDYFHRAY